MKDRNGTELKIGDIVHCNGLEFTIDEFQELGEEGYQLACGKYGCISVDLLEKIDSSVNDDDFKANSVLIEKENHEKQSEFKSKQTIKNLSRR